MMNRTICLLISICLTFASLQTALAEEVDLELVLLADASGSIDDAEIRFQRRGYAQAITDPDVISAILGTAYQKIAVTYVEWGDHTSQDVVVGWMVIDGKSSAEIFAKLLVAAPRKAYGYNAIGTALLYGKALIETNDVEGFRRVIDFSADSANNWDGPPIHVARAEVLNAGITINGLAVLCRYCSGRPVTYDLEQAFEDEIIGGPGAFVITADNSATFAAAVRRKLILEIAGAPAPSNLASSANGTPIIPVQ